MKVVLFGATGMIGKGVLLEALDHDAVSEVLCIGRRKVDVTHDKLRQIEHADFTDFSALAGELSGLDACFWCLGISSAGMDEARYTEITHAYTMAAARVLHAASPKLCFCFVSGAGTDATERGRSMWARVKGKTENDLKKVGFRELVIFRPAFIRPMRGVGSRTALYRVLYAVIGFLGPAFRALGLATSTVEMGRAMLAAAHGRAEQQILDSRGINDLAAKL